MSLLGKKPIIVPAGVSVVVKNGDISVKGAKGELSRKYDSKILNVEIKDSTVFVTLVNKNSSASNFWGTCASHIKNMIDGVSEGFTKKLLVEGVGFKAQVEGNNLVLNLGLSHSVVVAIPKGLDVKAEKNVITVSGIDKEKVGQFCSSVRILKKPEPYQGKGIRYDGEVIRRKTGKKATATAA